MAGKYAWNAAVVELDKNGAAGDLLVDLLERMGHRIARAHYGNTTNLYKIYLRKIL